MLGSVPDAEEAVQDSFIRAHRALRECREPERFGGWLFAILVNRCRTSRRRMFRRDRFKVSLPANLVARGDDVAAFEWREEIARALGRLRPIYREAFLLRPLLAYNRGRMPARMAMRTSSGNEPA